MDEFFYLYLRKEWGWNFPFSFSYYEWSSHSYLPSSSMKKYDIGSLSFCPFFTPRNVVFQYCSPLMNIKCSWEPWFAILQNPRLVHGCDRSYMILICCNSVWMLPCYCYGGESRNVKWSGTRTHSDGFLLNVFMNLDWFPPRVGWGYRTVAFGVKIL